MSLISAYKRRYNREKFAPDVKSNPGSKMRPVYQGQYDDDGKFSLVKVGEENLFEEIQIYAPTCTIDFILARYSAGDVEAINQAQGFYGDITSMPKSLSGMLNTIENGKTLFEKLPADVKAKFGNDFSCFVSTAGTDGWYAALGRDPERSKSEEVINPVKPPVVVESGNASVLKEEVKNNG